VTRGDRGGGVPGLQRAVGGRARRRSARSAPPISCSAGGAVYTVDAPRSWATAVGVRDGRISYVGGAVRVMRTILEGKTVFERGD
jgi:hypothetical protein